MGHEGKRSWGRGDGCLETPWALRGHPGRWLGSGGVSAPGPPSGAPPQALSGPEDRGYERSVKGREAVLQGGTGEPHPPTVRPRPAPACLPAHRAQHFPWKVPRVTAAQTPRRGRVRARAGLRAYRRDGGVRQGSWRGGRTVADVEGMSVWPTCLPT